MWSTSISSLQYQYIVKQRNSENEESYQFGVPQDLQTKKGICQYNKHHYLQFWTGSELLSNKKIHNTKSFHSLHFILLFFCSIYKHQLGWKSDATTQSGFSSLSSKRVKLGRLPYPPICDKHVKSFGTRYSPCYYKTISNDCQR